MIESQRFRYFEWTISIFKSENRSFRCFHSFDALAKSSLTCQKILLGACKSAIFDAQTRFLYESFQKGIFYLRSYSMRADEDTFYRFFGIFDVNLFKPIQLC